MVRMSRAAARFWVPLSAGILMYALALLGAALTRHGGALATVWLANGVIVALLLHRRRREWLGLFAAAAAGGFAAGLTAGDEAGLALALTLCNLAEIAVVALLYRRRFGPSTRLAAIEQLGFLGLCALAGPALSTPLAGLALTLFGDGATLFDMLRWYVADTLGLAITIPLLLALFRPDRSIEPGRTLEFALLAAFAMTCAAWVFSRQTSSLFLLTPVMVLAALRFRLDRVAVIVVLTAAVALALTGAGFGPLAPLDPYARTFILGAFVATAVMLTLPIAALRQERARTAAALRLSEEHYRLLADNSSDLVLRLSPNGQADYVSTAASRLLGIPTEALRGQALAARIHPDDQSRFTAAIDRARRTGDSVTCFRMRHAQGWDRWIEAHMRLAGPAHAGPPTEARASCAAAAEGRCLPGAGAPCTDECEPAASCEAAEQWPIVASLRDIHARRSAELLAADSAARLRESNRLLLMAEELAALGHWVLDPARQELVLSREAATLLGLAQLTLPVAEAMAMLRRADRLPLLRSIVAARRVEAPLERTVLLGEGDSARTLQLRMQVNGEGADSSLFGVVTDITAKLEAERRLIAALDEARSAASFRSQFLATMSHEIRTPMTGVIGMIELLEADPRPAERRLYLRTLRQSGDLLMAVLNDILDFSKIDAGRLAITDEPFDVGEALLTTLRLFDRPASARGLTLTLDAPPPGTLWLRGDSVRLRQVLSNFLSNAIKFSERGEVGLRCEAAPASHGRHRLRLSVTDHGIGIGPDLRARLFEPFVQGEESGAAGTGLGLAISRRLVAAMGGTLTLHSEPGHGSTFTVTLSLPAAAAPAGPHGSADRAPLRPLSILLAEDNAANQLLVTALCKRMGHRVTCVADGELAVARAEARAFDLILMDMQMPRCDGLTAARRIRAGKGPNAAAPIVALTADASEARRPLYAEAGIDALHNKPIDSRAFARTLAEIAAAPSRSGSARRAPVAALPSPEPLDHATLDEVRTAIGAARLDRLLDLLGDELDQRPLALRAAIADRDFAAAAAEAHSLKGAAANLGATPVSAAAEALEQAIAAAAGGDPRLLAAGLRRLAGAVSDTQQALAHLRHQASAQAVGA